MNNPNIRSHLAKSDIEDKKCAFCGEPIIRKRYKSKLEDFSAYQRRKYCSFECMRRGFVIQGKNTAQGKESAHHSSRLLAYLIEEREMKCEICGSTKSIDVHHKDGNYTNNTSENLQVLCRSCHLKAHRPKGTCIICGEEHCGKGFCDKHLQRFRKYGNPFVSYHKFQEDEFNSLPEDKQEQLKYFKR